MSKLLLYCIKYDLVGALGNGKRRGKEKEWFLAQICIEEFSSLEECFSNTSLHNSHFGSLCSMQRIPGPIAINSDSEVSGVWPRIPFLANILGSLNANSYLNQILRNTAMKS